MGGHRRQMVGERKIWNLTSAIVYILWHIFLARKNQILKRKLSQYFYCM